MLHKIKCLLVKTPDEVLGNILTPFFQKNGAMCKRILVVSLLTCIFNYFYFIVNGYSGPDAICEGVWYYTGQNNAIINARWAIPYLNSFFGKNVVIPLVIVVFYCLAIAVSSFILFKILEINNAGFQIFTVAAMVSFPVITRQFAYLYMALIYAISFLMVVLAAWFLRKRTIIGFLLGTISLLVMFGSFQSYIGAAAAIVLICFLYDIIKRESVITALKNAGIYVLSGVLAGGLDLVIANAMINLKELEAGERVTSFSVSEVLKYLDFSLPASYRWFFTYFDNDVLSRGKLYLVLFVLLSVLILINMIVLIKFRKFINSILVLVGYLLLPLAMNICVVIFPHNGIYDVMRYQYVLIVPLGFALFGTIPRAVYSSLLQWVVYMDVFLLIMGYTISSNASAICYKLAYESTHDQAISILTRVYELEEFDLERTPIVFGGQNITYQDTYEHFGQLFRYAIMDAGPVFWGGEYGLTTCRYLYFLNYLGVNTQWITGEQYRYVTATQEYAAMPCWPAEGSVQMIDGYAVIKMAE